MRFFAALFALLPAFAHGSEPPEAFREGFLEGRIGWEETVARAEAEGGVTFYHWGGSDLLNVWLDREIAPAMAARGIRLETRRLANTADAVDLVLAEARAGRGLGDGSVDVLWVNGENFHALAQQRLLFGGFAPLLPSAAHLEWDETDPRAVLNLRDFGFPTEGREMPWSREQYVCAADRRHLAEADTPRTFEDLRAWLEANPGKFTYVRPPHYIGNTFVQQALYAFNPDGTGASAFQRPLHEIGAAELARLIRPGMAYLRALEPLLLDGRRGRPRYPATPAAAEALFRDGEIHILCQFGLYAVATGRLTGAYPEMAEEIVFPEGHMIANKSYLAIPSNAPNPAAALVFIDYMTSVEAQVSMLETIGFPPGIDAWRLSPEDAARLEAAAPGHFGVTAEALAANVAPDMNASLVDAVEAIWLAYVERRSDRPFEEIVEETVDALMR